MTTTASPLLARLAAALSFKAGAIAAQLDALDEEVARAFDAAERAADVRITAALVHFEATLAERGRRFDDRLADMADSAFTAALATLAGHVGGLGARVDGMPVGAGVAEGDPLGLVAADDAPDEGGEEPAEEPTTAAESEEVADLAADTQRSLFPDPAEEPTTTTPPVYQASAARSLERDAVGVLAVASPDDPEDDDDLDGEDEEPRATPPVEVAPSPTTTDPAGLHEQRGRGRSIRYVPCPLPIPGEVYFRKAGRRWVPVEYVGD